jgi:hypothetical protein
MGLITNSFFCWVFKHYHVVSLSEGLSYTIVCNECVDITIRVVVGTHDVHVCYVASNLLYHNPLPNLYFDPLDKKKKVKG